MHAISSNHSRKNQPSRYIGRVGALALALGVGLATTTVHGLGVAHADTDDGPAASDTASSSSPSQRSGARAELRRAPGRLHTAERPRLDGPRTQTRAPEAAHTDTASDGRSSDTSRIPTRESPNTRITLPDNVSLDTGVERAAEGTAAVDSDVVPDTPDTGVVTVPDIKTPQTPSAPTDTPLPVSGDSGGGRFSPPLTEESPALSQPGSQSDVVSTPASRIPRIARPEAAARVETLRERLNTLNPAPPTDPSTPARPWVQHSNPITGLIAIPVAAVVAVPAVVAKAISTILAPLLHPGPGAPIRPPLLWNVLTWAVREIQNTFFNRRPRVAPQTIDVSLDVGDTTGPLSFNGFDPDGNPVTYTVSTPMFGTVAVNQDTGEFTYTLTDPNHQGTDQFTVTISDAAPHLHLAGGCLGAHGHASTAVITLNISAANHAPIATPDEVTTHSGVPVTFSVTDNDSDPDGDPLTVTLFTEPGHGTLVLNDDGTFTYTPDKDFAGEVSFTYTIEDTHGLAAVSKTSITVLKPALPLQAEDDKVTTDEDKPTVIDVLANDSPGSAGGAHIVDLTQPRNGKVVLNANGTLTYTPNRDWNGVDSFEYTVQNAAGERATATVHLTVKPVNDAPVVVSAPDHLVLDEDSAAGGVITVVDPDGDDVKFDFGTVPEHGTVTISGGGALYYQPNADFHGSDSFTVVVHDSHGASTTIQISVTVNPVDDPPVAHPAELALDEDTAISGTIPFDPIDADGQHVRLDEIDGVRVNPTEPTTVVLPGGVLTVTPDGQFTYTPNADFHGTETLTYTVVDEVGNHAESTMTFHVLPVNDPPVAVDDTYQIPIAVLLQYTFAGNVLVNDFDVDNPSGTLRAILVGEPVRLDGSAAGSGTLTSFHLAQDGSFEITVLGGLLGITLPGTWAFTYRVTDGQSLSNVATATIRWV